MPKGKTEKKEPTLTDIMDVQGQILGEMNNINQRVMSLEDIRVKSPTSRPSSTVIHNDGEVKAEVMETSGIKGSPVSSGFEPGEPKEYPVPDDYIKAKNNVLGKDFGIRMMNEADRPSFELQIIVPQSKSNMTDLQKDLSAKVDDEPVDIRTMAFNHGSGASSIQSWLMLIRQNLKLDG